MTASAAYLRVYQPLAALDEQERAHWSAYVTAGEVPSRPVQMAEENRVAVAAAIALPPRVQLGDEADHAYVRHVDGEPFVCPWRLQLRVWEALEEFEDDVPAALREAFLPEPVSAAASEAHEGWVVAHPDVRPPIIAATWHVPVPWFTLFEGDERRLVLGDRRRPGTQAQGGAVRGLDRALVYLTEMSRARRRVARALHAVRKAYDDTPATEGIEEIARWLEEFHPHSLVELDYGGLVHLVDDETLSADSSVADIGDALQRLTDGDAAGATAAYERVVLRWRSLAALEHAN